MIKLRLSLLIVFFLAGCQTLAAPSPNSLTAATPAPSDSPTPAPRLDGLTDAQAAALDSLEKVDDYPLYVMHYAGAPAWESSLPASSLLSERQATLPAWGCSLFAALADRENMLYGRNFDWEYSPALLLFTDPPQGYASVSMVDITYLGFAGEAAKQVLDLPLAERKGLLEAALIPFDGMNEHGLVVGMAAVPPGNVPPDPGKETMGSLGVIRKVLDGAKNVDEAVAILSSFNIDFQGGPPVHYLVADRSGRAILVEYYQGGMKVIPNDQPWHQATNFLRSSVGESAAGQCWRYDTIEGSLSSSNGRLSAAQALSLLESVAQDITQWSVVYGITTGEIRVIVGRKFETVHTFKLPSGGS